MSNDRRRHGQPMGNHRGQLLPDHCQAATDRPAGQGNQRSGSADGLKRLSGRYPPAGRDGSPNPSSCRRAQAGPADLGKSGMSDLRSHPTSSTRQSWTRRCPTRQPPHTAQCFLLRHVDHPFPAGRVKGAYGAAPRALRAPLPASAAHGNDATAEAGSTIKHALQHHLRPKTDAGKWSQTTTTRRRELLFATTFPRGEGQ